MFCHIKNLGLWLERKGPPGCNDYTGSSQRDRNIINQPVNRLENGVLQAGTAGGSTNRAADLTKRLICVAINPTPLLSFLGLALPSSRSFGLLQDK